MRLAAWLWKWLFCAWAHRRQRCYPAVWCERPEDHGWHCHECHPCGESLEAILDGLRDTDDLRGRKE